MKIALDVNGERHETEAWGGESLLYVLRERLGLPGSKNACEQGECGSCSVLLDGALVCCLPRARSAGRRSRGDDRRGAGATVTGCTGCRRHSSRPGAVQCGFCTPGLVVATVDLLASTPDPTDDEIREALSGNLCRCTGYAKIFDAVRLAATS